MPHREMRLLFYCQDAAGLGHLRRAVTLAALDRLGRDALIVSDRGLREGIVHAVLAGDSTGAF